MSEQGQITSEVLEMARVGRVHNDFMNLNLAIENCLRDLVRALAAELTSLRASQAALVERLAEARDAIAAADKETWGYSHGEDEHGQPFEWCVRDELVHNINADLTALAQSQERTSEGAE